MKMNITNLELTNTFNNYLMFNILKSKIYFIYVVLKLILLMILLVMVVYFKIIFIKIVNKKKK